MEARSSESVIATAGTGPSFETEHVRPIATHRAHLDLDHIGNSRGAQCWPRDIDHTWGVGGGRKIGSSAVASPCPTTPSSALSPTTSLTLEDETAVSPLV